MKKVFDKIFNLMDVIICIMVIIVALSKGGFYKEDIAFPSVIITFIGFIYVIFKLVVNIKENGVIKKTKLVTVLDCLIAAFPLAYILPVVFGTSLSIEGGISEAIKILNFTTIYFIVRTSKNTDIYFNLLIVLSVIICIFGFDEITYRIFENLGVTYLPRNGSVISSVVQYANVAGIIMIIGLNVCIYRLCAQNKKTYAVIICVLECAISLTASRMTLVLLIFSVILASIRYRSVKLVFYTLINIFTCGIQTKLIEANQYALGIFILVLPISLGIIMKSFKKLSLKSLSNSKGKKVEIYLLIIVTCIVIIIGITPVNLVIEAKYDEKNIAKRITEFVTGDNRVSIEVEGLTEDTEYAVQINQIYDDYSTWNGKMFKKEGNALQNFVLDLNISHRAKFLELNIIVYSGKIKVKNFKINDKDVTLSYLLLPDKLVSRIKDSFTFDYSNMLRGEYYLDALKLIKKSPFIGLGGEGFKWGYQMVQESPYISSEVHSSALQIVVESGIIGGMCYILAIITGFVICIKLYKADKNTLCLYITLICFIVMSTFDLTLSFSITAYLLAVILGMVANIYSKQDLCTDEVYEIDNKSFIAMVKIPMLCLSVIVFFVANVYLFKNYRAGMLILPEITDGDMLQGVKQQDVLYKKITVLEKKLELDKFNINYMTELNNSYEEYIELLKMASFAVVTQTDKGYINEQLGQCVVKQKNNIDNMVECEYYNKYALEQVARCYFANYVRYSELFSQSFENTETAYAFFLNYALKLTQRIKEVGRVNKVANSMYQDILETNIDNLANQNKILGSNSVQMVIDNMKTLIAK